MRILTRYILKEIASHALIGVALFTFIIFMRDLGRLLELIVRNSAPLPSVAEIFLFTLPATFTITIPMGVLVGILVGLSRLGRRQRSHRHARQRHGRGNVHSLGLNLRHWRVAAGAGEQHLSSLPNPPSLSIICKSG